MPTERTRDRSLSTNLPEPADLVSLLSEASEELARLPSLERVSDRSVVVVGDTHGDVETSKKAVEGYLGEGTTLMFLGDYVDRGPFQLENLIFLLEEFLKDPRRLILLRGNHETPEMNEWYGFREVVNRAYGPEYHHHFWSLFAQLPISALIGQKLLAVHGGIARELRTLGQLEELPKGVVSPQGILAELLWNDPDERIDYFEPSSRGPGTFRYGVKAVSRFLQENGLRSIVRSHEPRPDGASVEMEGKVYTVFSCRQYGIKPGALTIHGDDVEAINL